MRIISGSARGQRLTVPEGLNTRPAMDRTREAVFSMLGDVVRDAVVVDLFAGCGSYGLEALSRGAASCQFVDNGIHPQNAIRDNARAARLDDRIKISGTDVVSALNRFAEDPAARFDLAFADPPYADSGELARLLDILPVDRLVQVLRPNGILVLELPAKTENLLADGHRLEILTSRCYGNSRIEIYRAEDSEPNA